MIKEFVLRWESDKDEALSAFAEETPDTYLDLVRQVFQVLVDEDDDTHRPDVEKLAEWSDGDYSGTNIYTVPNRGYDINSPGGYAVCVAYGSCSGCDTLEALRMKDDPDRVSGLMMLALHIVQAIRPLPIAGGLR